MPPGSGEDRGRRSVAACRQVVPSQGQPLRALVVGAGAFGRNHLRVYRELAASNVAVELSGVIDADPSALAKVSADFGVRAFPSVPAALEALGKIDAASVCVPTRQHASVADPLLAAGVACLIEKPLAATLEEADRIVAAGRASNALVQAGHLERFNPAVTAARAHINRPMFFEAHRLSVFTPRSLDVDVVLDLMIHDLDVVLSFVDSPVREIRAVGLPVLSRKVDIANVRVEFENGCIANFTASRVSTERVRKLRFFQPHQYLSLDFARQDLLVIDAPDVGGLDPAHLAALAQSLPPGAHPSAGLSLNKITVQPGEPLRLEIESFLNAIRNGAAPVVSGEDGRRALALALLINEAIRAHSARAGL